MMDKSLLKKMIPSKVWTRLRTRSILRQHRRVADLCESLISEYYSAKVRSVVEGKKDLSGKKIVWQYWAQGFENVPTVVRECLESVEKWRGDYEIIRLTDETVFDYVDIPETAASHCRQAGLAQYSDLLRLALLSAYGGVWLDATVMLTGPLPEEYSKYDFFMFQRDPNEPHKDYWENVYAYYYGWRKDFRVNVLSSIIFARQGCGVISDLYGLMVFYWANHTIMPDYFFLHILFDVLINGRHKGNNCPIVSDCTPHLLQQSINDPAFDLATKDEILRRTSIHKLTYK